MRAKTYLKQHYAAITSYVGLILLLAGGVMLIPLVVVFVYPEEVVFAAAFALPAGVLVLLGMTLHLSFRTGSAITLSVQEGGIIVLISWIAVILVSAWPFMAVSGLSFSRALFEAMSGWTTTGLSVMDVTKTDRIILLWRSIIQWAGGAGLAIIMMSAIVGPTGIGIASAEGRSDQLVPQVRQSARLVLLIYCCYAVGGIIAYRFAGMTLFDAINHSFTAVSTGGFSTRTESIGYWNSPSIEIITLMLMLLGNLSFVTAWFLWRGKFRVVVKNSEVRLLSLIIPLSVVLVFFYTCRALYPHLEKSIRVAVFETVSAITTTGFSTVGYADWNDFGVLLLIVLMIIGGGTCSTAGGLKQFRVYLLWKLIFWEIRRYLASDNAVMVRPIWEGNRRVFVDDTRIRHLVVFVVIYLWFYALGVMLLSICGFSLKDSLFEFASALGTVGLSVGVTSVQMPDLALWAETCAMFLGRMEFTVVIISLLKLGKDTRLLMERPHKSIPVMNRF